MKQVVGYWLCKDHRLPHGDGRPVAIGVTHKVEGEIVPCYNGLHLSEQPLDALLFNSGPIIYKVRGTGKIVPHGDPVKQYACAERTYLAGGCDCSELLLKFARMCALDVVCLWDAPDVVVTFLKTGDKSLRESARKAALSVAEADYSAAAEEAAWAAEATAWAAEEAAWDTEGAAHSAAVAAYSAAGAAAYTAFDGVSPQEIEAKQNARLKRMLSTKFKRGDWV